MVRSPQALIYSVDINKLYERQAIKVNAAL